MPIGTRISRSMTHATAGSRTLRRGARQSLLGWWIRQRGNQCSRGAQRSHISRPSGTLTAGHTSSDTSLGCECAAMMVVQPQKPGSRPTQRVRRNGGALSKPATRSAACRSCLCPDRSRASRDATIMRDGWRTDDANLTRRLRTTGSMPYATCRRWSRRRRVACKLAMDSNMLRRIPLALQARCRRLSTRKSLRPTRRCVRPTSAGPTCSMTCRLPTHHEGFAGIVSTANPAARRRSRCSA